MHHGMEHFGFSLPDSGRVPFNWGTLKANIDSYILRLNGIYRNNLRNSGTPQKKKKERTGRTTHTRLHKNLK